MSARVHACLECGGAFTPRAVPGNHQPEFCSNACRSLFNNRRKRRGAEFYDLIMAHRFEREEAQQLRVLSKINRLASIYRQQDKDARSARRSWRKANEVIGERPYLSSVTIVGRRRP